MFKKEECVAMLLAGGQGSRLYTLTEKNAKPAVPFGGKYRIIDFPLSNCIHSGIDTVGVLTQYQPLMLNEYIGSGQPWDMDRLSGGVTVLPPYQGKSGADWYKGTANAIYQNLHFLKRYSPEYILVLSGDHIYKMDYAAMLTYHKKKHADCTIAVIEVPIWEASRFGIMHTEKDGRIDRFDEKPAKPISNQASMGIYIFNSEVLYQYLEQDAANDQSAHDFGQNIIPTMIQTGEKLYAYPFQGYWKDVGTLESFWQANMDLLGTKPAFDLNDRSFRIFSRSKDLPPQFIGDEAQIQNSIISEGCEIFGHVENSILFGSVKVEKGAHIKDSILFSDVSVGKNTKIEYAIIDEGTLIKYGCQIGAPRSQNKLTVIGASLTLKAKTIIEGGAMLNLPVQNEKERL
ncbi:MAG: glucose-1-phosphate adenylyltransferase [Clostridiales bacterium]|nr:glucose-1-phosphate adenylyltransferase [Clostridiales bacterium]